jgi:hypothetical protein
VFSLVPFKVLVRLLIVFPELSDNILANVTVVLLHFACNPQLILRWNIGHFSSFSHQIKDELRDIAASDRDVFDRAADDVPLSARNNVGDTVARINDSSCECAIGNAIGGPGSSECKHRLDGDIQSLDVE